MIQIMVAKIRITTKNGSCKGCQVIAGYFRIEVKTFIIVKKRGNIQLKTMFLELLNNKTIEDDLGMLTSGCPYHEVRTYRHRDLHKQTQ